MNLPENITEIIKEREQARKDKNWSKSDELRDKLFSLGYTVKDTPNGMIVETKM